MNTKSKYAAKTAKDSLNLLNEIGGRPKLCNMLRSERERLGWTMEELGKAIGVSRQYINNVEKGIKNLSIEQAVRFADAVGKSPEIYIELLLQEMIDRSCIQKKYRVLLEVASF